MVGLLCYDVEHPVYAVDQVYVECSWRSVEWFGSYRSSFGRVAGEVVWTQIGLRFGDDVGEMFALVASHEFSAQQVFGDYGGLACKK